MVEEYELALSDPAVRMAYLVWHALHAMSSECARCRKRYKPAWCFECFKRGDPVAVRATDV